MADEIELKLELTPEAANLVEASPLLASDPAKAIQRSIYFDTPDSLLFKAGLSLRIRCSRRKRIQTVKVDGRSAAGLFARSEWEQVVKDDMPVLDDSTPILTLLRGKARAIAPAFEVHVERRTWNIREGDAAIELVLDRGEIIAGDRRIPVCEIELELKEGDPAALFAFARKVDAVAPLRLGVLSKAERGYRLRGPAVAAVKAEPIALNGDMTPAMAFQYVAGACVRQFRSNEALLKGRGEDALHQTRVGLRRLRSALLIFEPLFAGEEAIRLREELRWLAAELGDARNLDVLIARSVTGSVRSRLEAACEDAYLRAAKALASTRARTLMLDLSEWIATGSCLKQTGIQMPREQALKAFASQALDRMRRKVKKAGRDLIALDDVARHQVRKEVKKLRYAAEFFSALFDSKREKRRYKRYIDTLECLQNELGALNDLAAATMILDRLGLSDDPEAQSLLAADKKNARLKVADEAKEELLDAKRFWR
jgi:inorganic triphosphatase YgiF